jgi:acetyl esterase
VKPRDRVTRRTAPWLTWLPPRVELRLSGRPPIEIDGQRLDPEVQLLLSLRERLQPPVWDASISVERGREITREEAAVAAGPRKVEVGAVRDLTAAGLPARLYTPDEPGPHPLLVYFHGGGFVAGDLDTHDAPCRVLCRHSGAAVLAVAYRLAPENPFPAYVEDALLAYDGARERVADDPARVAVGGDSAGGNLAAVVALVARDDGLPAPVHQLLVYPVVDYEFERPSMIDNATGYFLEADTMRWFYDHYARTPADFDDWRMSPLRAPDVANVAPATILTAEYDPLRDQGEAYGQRLQEAGVPAQIFRADGVFHGYFGLQKFLPPAKEPWDIAVSALRSAFGTV